MLLSLFIIIPFVVGFSYFVLDKQKPQTILGFFASLILLVLSVYLFALNTTDLTYRTPWFSFNNINTYFALNLNGLSGLMVLLSNIVFTVLFLYLYSSKQKYSNKFYGLLLLTLAGLNGVFMAEDLILFYFFWEIVLIPVYFLIGIWGQKKSKISSNVTFFIYTVFGSMLMLGGIVYIGYHLKPNSFLINDIVSVISPYYTNLTFLSTLFLIAFAIKIPLFPLHSWQPNVYKASPTPVTVVLSALMAKMGLFAVVKWYMFLFPVIGTNFSIVLFVAGFGIIYGSLIALSSNNIKKIIAYSSIAHLALIFITLFSKQSEGVSGAYFQMFSHGLVVLGLWLCVDIMERNYKVTNIKTLGGLASIDPVLSIFFMVFGLANIALPLTSSFIGEFMMLSALFKYNTVLCLFGCSGVILSAIYTLRMMTAMLFGEIHHENVKQINIKNNNMVYIILAIISVMIIILGIYPSIIFNFLIH